jgi:ABC-type transport system involved in multi-copper enzyme maturation permease subunit
MFQTILRRELQGILSSFIFLSSLAVLTVMVLLSALIQARYYKSLVEDYALRQVIHQAENTERAIALTRPPPLLLPFFNGVFDSLPDEYRFRSDLVSADQLSGDLMPMDWLFPKIDLSFITGVLMTLMAILVAHDTIAGDRERGTLKLILAGPISRRTVLAAKLSSIILPMNIALAYVVALYIVVVVAFSGGSFDLSVTSFGELAVYTLVAVLVLIVFVALGTAISIIVRRSSVALALCASIWIGAVLIWPSLGPYIAYSFKPVPTWEAAQREMSFKEKELIQAELVEHRKSAIELKTQNAGAETAWRRYLELKRRWLERRNEEIGRLNNEREKQIRSQQLFAKRFLLFSPYGSFKEILGSLCGTGLESYDEFLASVESYKQQEFLPAGFDLLSRQKPWLDAPRPDERIKLRPFQVPSPTLTARLMAALWPLGLLVAEMILLTIVCIFSFERYDVR